ncbi:galactose mutarotase-like protein [Marasmius fiardii PR-910]|nr:galactose mutarotase-like protein [Marasmius fiardii PR-910]
MSRRDPFNKRPVEGGGFCAAIMLTTAFATLFLASLSFVQAAEPAWPFDLTTISAPDGSITAKFVSVGATMTELWVKDRNGKARDVILGYDDNSKLLTDPDHPVFNPIVGRYANRLKNGTFSIPITKTAQPPGPGVYQIPTNDHDGQVTLHGGILGWDRRNWTVVSKTRSSVTYKHLDAADEGFPGNVTAFATHTVSNGGTLKTTVFANATEKTPIMLTQHIYWNLDAFQDGTNDILSHHLQVDSSKVVDLDGNAIPTGKFISAPGTPFDFRKEQKIGARWNDTIDLCGQGCQGYDHCWIYDHDESSRTGTSLWSDKSGIRVDISSNQPAVQVYTSFWLNTPRKQVHGGPNTTYSRWSAVAIEQEGYVDAINTPEWNVDQIYGPDRDFTWSSTYKFSVVP